MESIDLEWTDNATFKEQTVVPDRILTDKLEVNVVRHCQNRCACCNHASPFADPYYMDPAVLERDLRWLKPIFQTGFLCLQGGELLLHPAILDLIDIAWKSGVGDVIGILSNGRMLPKMEDGFWKKCKEANVELRVSVYSNLPQETLDIAKAKAEQFGINYRPGLTPVFVKVLGDYPDGRTFERCPWRVCHTLHEGYFYICPISTFWPKDFMGLPAEIDGYPIEGTTEEGLRDFIYRTTPLRSCTRCTGTQAGAVLWHEVTSREEWIKESSA